MHDADPACAELVSAARNTPADVVTHLLHSDDPRTVRLGRAVQAVQAVPGSSQAPPPVEPADGARIIDPITHDPAW
ncbi:hypothetical protein A6P39_005340 [Streptomyces sp. FXJ1.172]|uniref:hypothetical protein n=1 Tax=Streptomyces sp. FXJ1.172 TaxID=710705 RepID=UPI0007CFEEF3|nr:hypothetical protein [Streptomyces sp. FXJ1.172]WEO93488.1 hypothetical protein A6P39_005340 [Streptomyces sp. FXJ1.172]